jgi:hypothetical protein
VITIGWREWVALPGLGVPLVKAKVDTGARTSSLHTLGVEPFDRDARRWVRFRICPLQERTDVVLDCEAEVVDLRRVTNSGGEAEERFVIRTPLCIGGESWPIELTLASRETMTFRMLLGRTALRGHALVDAGRSYLTGVHHHHACEGADRSA